MFMRKKALLCVLLMAVLFVLPTVFASADTLVVSAEKKSVGADAFRGDKTLGSVVLEEGITSVGSGAFADSSLREITLPSSLTYIAENAFDGAPLDTVHAKKGTYAYKRMRECGYIAEYRALLIGEQRYVWFISENDPDNGSWLDEDDQRNIADVNNFTNALGNTVGPDGAYGPQGRAFRVTQKTNLSAEGVRESIGSAFADTLDQDISVFFIASHGRYQNEGELLMAFTGSFSDAAQRRAYWKERWLSFETLASWLKESVKGRIFIVLESCGAGSSIYDVNDQENSARLRSVSAASSEPSDEDLFAAKAVEAFSRADPGVILPSPERGNAFSAKTSGELRVPKFYVLAASRHHEKSYGWETGDEDAYNYFTKWLIEGIGSAGDSPADTNGDGFLSLHEMFSHVSQYEYISYMGEKYYQHVQRWPAGNTDSLLKLEEPFSYKVTDVQGKTHITGSETDTAVKVLRSSRPELAGDRFEMILVDGKAAAPGCCTVSKEGDSLILTLKSSWLDSLSAGEHTITVLFSDGDTETVLTIKARDPKPVPVTGDRGEPALWLGLLLLGLAGLSAAGALKRSRGRQDR